MLRTRWLGVAVVIAGLAGAVVVPSAADAGASGPTIHASRSSVLESDPVTLTGRSAAAAPVYRSLDRGHFVRIGSAHPSLGRYAVTVHPVAGHLNQYRVGESALADVRAKRCTPLANEYGTQAWLNIRHADTSTLATKWSQLICSAAPSSSLTLASMFIFGGGGTVDSVINHLRDVATLRNVHVHILVDRSLYPAKPEVGRWTWSQFWTAFRFADRQWCVSGCAMGGQGQMHSKFMTISALRGSNRPAVLESSLNWSQQQFVRQNGSAIYFHNNVALYRAFYAAFIRSAHRVPASAKQQPMGWRSAGPDVAYAFDPSPITVDPVVTELRTLVCRPGDYIDIVNANVTRSHLLRELSRLQSDGCAIRLVTEQMYQSPDAKFTTRHVTTHDRFTLVRAHDRSGRSINEVIAGAEVYRPGSMVFSEEQLVRARVPSVAATYAGWFTHLFLQG